MEQRKSPEYHIELLVDPACVRDVVRGRNRYIPYYLITDRHTNIELLGILQTIFFHRFFPSIRPSMLDVLDFTLPLVEDPDLETLIETRVGQLVRQFSSASVQYGSKGTITVKFFERKRRKAGSGLGWFTGAKGEEEVCWERWVVQVALATPRTEDDRTRVTKAISSALQKATMKILSTVNREKEHIPPITTSETNPFPYSIDISPRVEAGSRNMDYFKQESLE